MGPQPEIIKAGDVGERVEASPMGIAGEVAELLQLAEDGERGIGTERLFEFRQVRDFMAAEVLTENGSVEGGGSHNVIVPTPDFLSRNYNIIGRTRRSDRWNSVVLIYRGFAWPYVREPACQIAKP